MVIALPKHEPSQPKIADELEALGKIVELMERSDADTKRRIMAYLNSRYPYPRFASYARD